MPELPEVETMRRGILGAVGGKIVTVEKVRCRKKPIAIRPALSSMRKRIVGQTVLKIDRIGKRVVMEIGRKQATSFLVFEPRMTGLVLVANPPTREHLRFGMTLGHCDVSQIYYWDRRGLGNVRLFDRSGLEEHLGPGKIGPDALKISLEEFSAVLRQPRREVKVALLDQKLIAGIGNLYASEMLHAAKVHPQRECRDLRQRDLKRMYEQMREILQKAIRYEGSTLSDGTYRNSLNQEGGYQNQHQVYDKEGEKCRHCRKALIERITQAQRSTFFCRRCQK
ncbi:MAG: bifunctional DNA-formamidopyrimidine glycosylase/DNA-(apurinic or apyrimidinic site) lyase [Planctomycetota bacterium]|nr:bifunctional DNA-formamidopyrimidine glycosylase/DNA-(apurinic or apyrimidinic site) lyase [Planctomycetota bacterium]